MRPMTNSGPIYLGDGVFLDTSQGQMAVLTVGNHVVEKATSKIYLEPAVAVEVVKLLAAWLEIKSIDEVI